MSRKKSKLQPQESPFSNLDQIIEREVGSQDKPKSRSKKKRPKASPTNVIFYKDQTKWLDKMCIQARDNDGKSLRRTELIRAIIDFAKAVDIDIRGIQSESEIVERLLEASKITD